VILITEEMIRTADAVIEAAEGVTGSTEIALHEALMQLTPVAKRRLAFQLLREAFDEDRLDEERIDPK
jgi:hypothetical protein